jgi:hypothetical protein
MPAGVAAPDAPGGGAAAALEVVEKLLAGSERHIVCSSA